MEIEPGIVTRVESEPRTSRLGWLGDATDMPWVIGGLTFIVALLGVVGSLLGLAALDVWAAVILFLLLGFAWVPLSQRIARVDGQPWLAPTLVAAFLAKMAASMLRLFVFVVVYDGDGDAGMYHQAGTVFARRFRDGVPIHPIPVIENYPRETHWIGDITGTLYTVTSPSIYAGFILFSFLCLIGLVLIFRGACRAVPEIDRKRLAHLVLFLPSLLFWPSSIGKEAVMILCLGLVSYGAGFLLAPRPRISGLGYFAGGLVVAAFIRPHIALMSVSALIVAVAVGALFAGGRFDGAASGGSLRTRAIRTVALVGLALLASIATTRFDERFGSGGDTEAAETSALETTLQGTSIGGSAFAPIVIRGPRDIPLGTLSVVFRPLPWEARSITSLIAAVETLVLLVISLASLRRIVRLRTLYLRRPFLVFASVFVLTFAVGFSYVANFGILARQRTQMMPMVLVLMALTIASPPRRGWLGAAPGGKTRQAGIVEEGELTSTQQVGEKVDV